MIYRTNPKNGDRISQLAFGCMRLPKKDVEKCRRLIDTAIENGVNYFDTAWFYPGNEVLLSDILVGPYRDRINLTSKLPMLMVKRAEDFDKYFNSTLQRLGTDRIDYYLLHMLTSFEYFERFRQMGVLEWAEKQKAAGRIRNFGFSFHGNTGSFQKIIDAYDWDFCMIQYNYLDTDRQAGTAGLKHAAAKGMPVMIMEPLRGGKLAVVPKEAQDVFEAAVPLRTPAEWGIRWVMNHPEVLTVLSGMNEPDQLTGNLKTASEMEAGAMTEAELAAIAQAKEIILSKTKVPCTGCEYCLPCPKNVAIPTVFRFWNGTGLADTSRHYNDFQYTLDLGILSPTKGYASQCVSCGACKTKCPQQIDIPAEIKKASKDLDHAWMKAAAKIARPFMQGKRR